MQIVKSYVGTTLPMPRYSDNVNDTYYFEIEL